MTGFKPLTPAQIYTDHGIDPKTVKAIAECLGIRANGHYGPKQVEDIVSFANKAKELKLSIPQAIEKFKQEEPVASGPIPSVANHQTSSPNFLDDFYSQAANASNDATSQATESSAVALLQQAEEGAAGLMITQNLATLAIYIRGVSAITNPALRQSVQRSEDLLNDTVKARGNRFSFPNLLRATGLADFQGLPSHNTIELPQGSDNLPQIPPA